MLLFDLPQQLMIACGLVAVSGITGFVSGCEYKKDQQAAEHLEEVKESARLEKKDGVKGANAVAELRKRDQATISAGTLLAQASSKPIVYVASKTPNCPIQVTPGKDSQAAPKTEEKIDETPAEIMLSKHGMWMYDLSIKPDDTGLRAGTYDAARELTVNEGYSLTLKNNLQCIKWRDQLAALISRIEVKQQIFGKKE